MKTKSLPRSRAFTLIELLTVIAILGILTAIFVPTVSKVRQNARNTQCIGNLRGLAMAQLAFAGENKGRFAGGYLSHGTNASPKPTWQRQLQPFLGRNGRALLQCPLVPAGQAVDVWAYPSYGINYSMLNSRWRMSLSAPPRRTAIISERYPDDQDYYNANYSVLTDAQWALILRHSDNKQSFFAFHDGSVSGHTRAEIEETSPAKSLHQWW